MPLKLMYITNNKEIAVIAENSGVDWIFIDLEIQGKKERQGHLDTVISHHSIDDVRRIKQSLTKAKLLVRVNPIYDGSKDEVDRVINDGADIVMLPFFKTRKEVVAFIEQVSGRAKTCLLCETPEAVDNIDDILTVKGIDYIHIGLNDLHLGYNMHFMFELLAEGIVENLCTKFKQKGIPYGFGGIARLGQGMLPAEHVISEHYRLGSSMAILSRAFCDVSKTVDINAISKTFKDGVNKIREYEKGLLDKNKEFFEDNRIEVYEKVTNIVRSITKTM